jgi:hypothetical protein
MPRSARTPASEATSSIVDDSPRLFSVHASARYTGLSYWAIRDLIIAGHLRAVRLPSPRRKGENLRRILVDRSDLDQLIAESKV